MTGQTSTVGDLAVIDAVADRLHSAARSGTPCAPVRDLLGTDGVSLAYAVQRRLNDRRLEAGSAVVGRKIGLTAPAVQQQLGVDQPDFGVLFDDMDASALPEIPSRRVLQPRAEAEIAFVLGEDLDAAELELPAVRSAVDHARAAIEIVDSRIGNWDIRITDTVADNASSGLYVLGAQRVPLSAFEPAEVTMELFLDGEPASRGNGAACLGDPLNALLWLARTARDLGSPLRAGQVVLSGALGPMVPTPPGSAVRAEISALGAVTTRFATEEQPRARPRSP